jgi:hypothetical protein
MLVGEELNVLSAISATRLHPKRVKHRSELGSSLRAQSPTDVQDSLIRVQTRHLQQEASTPELA